MFPGKSKEFLLATLDIIYVVMKERKEKLNAMSNQFLSSFPQPGLVRRAEEYLESRRYWTSQGKRMLAYLTNLSLMAEFTALAFLRAAIRRG